MRLTIANGFFLPVPPVSGGSTEKSWFHLGHEFAARGHSVTMISRRWRGFPDSETVDGITHIRLRGHSHSRSLAKNLLLDFLWSCRVCRALPEADIVIVNSVALPIWLGALKPRAGKVIIMTGRIPRGQYRHYRQIARVVAASSAVRDLVAAENPALGAAARVYGYPINWGLLSHEVTTEHPFLPSTPPNEVTIGYVGRLHEDKGLLRLAEALALVAKEPGLPPWRVMICGPSDIARGGSGAAFRAQLLNRLTSAIHPDRVHLLDPQFNERALAGLYRRIGIFCLPSRHGSGETFGVAAAEAMAAGAAPVVSNLDCFRDFIRDGETGLVFDDQAADAARLLADRIIRLLRDSELRHRIAAAAQLATQRYDYSAYAATLLDDFESLC